MCDENYERLSKTLALSDPVTRPPDVKGWFADFTMVLRSLSAELYRSATQPSKLDVHAAFSYSAT